MKRAECTVESLKARGYEAREEFMSWNSRTDKKLTGNIAESVFEAIVDAARSGRHVDITKNELRGEIIATIPGLRHENRGCTINYYLARPIGK